LKQTKSTSKSNFGALRKQLKSNSMSPSEAAFEAAFKQPEATLKQLESSYEAAFEAALKQPEATLKRLESSYEAAFEAAFKQPEATLKQLRSS
jgi:exonuclease VII small subunit